MAWTVEQMRNSSTLRLVSVGILSFTVTAGASLSTVQAQGSRQGLDAPTDRIVRSGVQVATVEIGTARPNSGESGAITLNAGNQLVHLEPQDIHSGYLYKRWVSSDNGHTWSGPQSVIPHDAGAPTETNCDTSRAFPKCGARSEIQRLELSSDGRVLTSIYAESWFEVPGGAQDPVKHNQFRFSQSRDLGSTWTSAPTIDTTGIYSAGVSRGGGALAYVSTVPEGNSFKLKLHASKVLDGQWATFPALEVSTWTCEPYPVDISDDLSYMEIRCPQRRYVSSDRGSSWTELEDVRSSKIGTCTASQIQVRLEKNGAHSAISRNWGKTWSAFVSTGLETIQYDESGSLQAFDKCEMVYTRGGSEASWLTNLDELTWTKGTRAPLRGGIAAAPRGTAFVAGVAAGDRSPQMFYTFTTNFAQSWTTPVALSGPLDRVEHESVYLSPDGQTAVVRWYKNDIAQLTTITLAGASQGGSIQMSAKRITVGSKRPIEITGSVQGISSGTSLQVMVKAAGAKTFRKGPRVAVAPSGSFSARLNIPKAVQVFVQGPGGIKSPTVTVR